MTGFISTIRGSVVIAAVSTLGDFIWATWIPQHRMVYGLVHGGLLFLCVGLFLGVSAGRLRAGALSGTVIGVVAAGSFYLLVPVTGFSAMFVVWIALWVALAVANNRLMGQLAPGREVMLRGTVAAVTSGAAFYMVSGIWRPFDPVGWDYLTHFAAWTVAFFPGFAALLMRKDKGY